MKNYKNNFLGVLAIDGKTGKRLWTQWAPHEVFAITCQGDLDKDGINDCVAGGRAGVSNLNHLKASFFESGPMPTPTKLRNPTINCEFRGSGYCPMVTTRIP